MKLEEILRQLTAWFSAEDHKERKLKGGGKWFYVDHQTIRDRLNEICPGEWSDEYRGPIISGDYVVMFCKLTICGVTHEGVADDKTFPDMNENGQAKIIGSPVVNATRHAFRDAAEKFGICAYLDDQKENRNKFVQYMGGRGDYRAYKAAHDNGWVENGKGETVKPRPRQPETGGLLEAMSGGKEKSAPVVKQSVEAKFFSQKQDPEEKITGGQFKRFTATAEQSGFTYQGAIALMNEYGYKTGGEIRVKHYEQLLSKAEDRNMAIFYNSKATTPV
jgi:hypothetical protein